MTEFNFSSFQPHERNLAKKEMWEKTIQVWDYLVENNYRPADFSAGVVTMRYEGFRKLILGWDLPLEEQIKNAETVADLEVLWKRFKPSDDATKELFKKRKGELNG